LQQTERERKKKEIPEPRVERGAKRKREEPAGGALARAALHLEFIASLTRRFDRFLFRRSI
jgi:hypothetical protein